MVRPPSGTVTFLFIAIEGSAAPGDGSTTEARERHDLAVRNAAEGHGGYVFRMGGDGSSATAFPAAGSALEAALEVQRALSNEDGGGFQVRMALHTGVAGESDGDYVGPPLSRVAGLLAAGHGGQILISAVTHGLVKDTLGQLVPGARLRYLGEHRVGDLGHAEGIFQLVVPGLPEVFPPLRTHGLVDTVSAGDTPQPQGPAHTTVSDQVLGDGRYQRRRLLGRGGMADVYLARDQVLDRDVAIKVLRHEYASNEQFVERFKREARSAASLTNPNIVGIYDRGDTGDGTYYIVMEYVAGTTLEDRIRDQGSLSSAASATVALRVAQALQVAHRRGIIHRDVKPQNILLGELGEVKVTDFGIARAASLAALTLEGSVMGTPHYISPEQAQGEEARSQSDLYSLGVVLYEMLTGELPFKADTPVGAVMQHIHGQARPPREVNPQIPERLNDITMRLLAKDPASRYSDAAELIEDLRRVKRRDVPTVAVGEQGGPGGSGPEGSRITRHEGGIVPPPPGEHTGDTEDEGGRRRKSLLWVLTVVLAVAGLLTAAALIIVPYTLLETSGNPKNADLHKPAEEVSFVHHATDENSRGDYTYINDPSINGDANAIVLVAPSADRGNAGDATYDHNIGVWYEGGARQWAIFNQDETAVPAGATFEVVVPPASQSFVHQAVPGNTISNSTYLDNPLTNGESNAGLSVTQNWNPGGGRGVYNDHPIGVVYDQDVQEWVIYNQDDALMPNGAAFNVAVSGNGEPAR